MPTVRPRHSITETDEVRAALDRAARRWPEESARPSRLLLRLIESGQHALDREEAEARERRRKAVRETAGMLTGVYPPGYLEELRNEWP
ncbi:MAG TPA: hypothetical protein VGO60_17665 [Iamia sp.]|jgi:hypothetical protein|nr:hypothetical protein [Iamia sp.]